MVKVQANMIFEIMGRPKEHLVKALELLAERIGSEKGSKMLDKKLHEPIPIKESDLFTSFAELSLELDSLEQYFGILFAYMPSNAEIVSPTSIALQNFQLTELANKLLTRLHDYDAITKRAVIEKNMALQKLKEVAPHLFKKEVEENKKLETKVESAAKAEKKSKKSKK